MHSKESEKGTEQKSAEQWLEHKGFLSALRVQPPTSNLQLATSILQNLGEEGTAYVIEALAFNPGCTAVDLSRNGIGKVRKCGFLSN